MSDYASLHWQELKKRVEAAGFPWINKADAAEKLAALGEKMPAVGVEPVEPVEPIAELAELAEPVAELAEPAKSGPRFDRSKPYGQIGGEVEDYPGACFQQNGIYFNSAGYPVEKV